MVTADGFEMLGYFKNGKACGMGRFTAPNGDQFFGYWNHRNRREGSGVFIKNDEDKQLIEIYEDGNLRKRIRMAKKLSNTTYWLPTPPFEFGVGSTPQGPSARFDHTMVVTGPATQPRLVLFGGRTADADGRLVVLGDIWGLDIKTMVWRQLPCTGQAPPPVYNHQCIVSGKMMYVIGGACQKALQFNDVVYALDLENLKWHLVGCAGNVPLGLAGHTATLVGSDIVVLFGRHIHVLNMITHNWKTVEPKHAIRTPARGLVDHCAVAHGSQIVVYGGEIGLANADDDTSYPVCSNEIRVLDTSSWIWQQIQPVTNKDSVNNFAADAAVTPWFDSNDIGVKMGGIDTPRSQHTMVKVDHAHAVIIGGWTSNNPKINVVAQSHLADVLIFNLDTKQLSAPFIKYPINLPRAGHAAVAVNGWVWVAGGSNASVGDRGLWDLALLHCGADARLKTE